MKNRAGPFNCSKVWLLGTKILIELTFVFGAFQLVVLRLSVASLPPNKEIILFCNYIIIFLSN